MIWSDEIVIEKISILGSTGSIGTQALDVVRNLKIKVVALAAKSNIDLLETQAREFKPEVVSVFDEKLASQLKFKLRDTEIKVLSGMEGLCEAASFKKNDLVLNSVVGMVGLHPTISAIKSGINVALANKETLVVGGELVTKLAKKNNVKIFPVDSEHSAIFQCLEGCNKKNELKKIILTASGGPFFGKKISELTEITPSDALKHPNWNMGSKITIDSATMMNKGLEIIEAVWLFGVPHENIDVVVHRESIIHSMIEYEDNSIIAQLGLPDMRIPIQYAITYPERVKSPVGELDLSKICKLSFYEPDVETFKCLNLCRKAISVGGTAPAVINAANEEAVKLFLSGKISFLDIGNVVELSLKNVACKPINEMTDIIQADSLARNLVKSSNFE